MSRKKEIFLTILLSAVPGLVALFGSKPWGYSDGAFSISLAASLIIFLVILAVLLIKRNGLGLLFLISTLLIFAAAFTVTFLVAVSIEGF